MGRGRIPGKGVHATLLEDLIRITNGRLQFSRQQTTRGQQEPLAHDHYMKQRPELIQAVVVERGIGGAVQKFHAEIPSIRVRTSDGLWCGV
jgi:hypothetical protein